MRNWRCAPAATVKANAQTVANDQGLQCHCCFVTLYILSMFTYSSWLQISLMFVSSRFSRMSMQIAPVATVKANTQTVANDEGRQ